MIPKANSTGPAKSEVSPLPGPEDAANQVLWPPPDADYYFRDTLPDEGPVLYRLARRGRHQGLTLYREDDEAGARVLRSRSKRN